MEIESKPITTSPDGFAANAVMGSGADEGTLFAGTMYGGRVIVAYNPDFDGYEGQVIRHDGSRHVFDATHNTIRCAAFPLDPDESSMNNLLGIADIVIKDSEILSQDTEECSYCSNPVSNDGKPKGLKMKKFHSAPMPSYWSSYLINGDASGLQPNEKERIDEYLKNTGISEVVDTAGESYFSWSCDLYGSELPGGDLTHYTVTYTTEFNDDCDLCRKNDPEECAYCSNPVSNDGNGMCVDCDRRANAEPDVAETD